jgi:hypothetical protein
MNNNFFNHIYEATEDDFSKIDNLPDALKNLQGDKQSDKQDNKKKNNKEDLKERYSTSMIAHPGVYFKVKNFTASWDASDYYPNTKKKKYYVPEGWTAPWFFYITEDEITVYYHNKKWQDELATFEQSEENTARFNKAGQLSNSKIEEWAEDFDLDPGQPIIAGKRKYFAFLENSSLPGAIASLEDEIVRRKKLFTWEKAETKAYIKKSISMGLIDSPHFMNLGGSTVGMDIFDIFEKIDWNKKLSKESWS